MVDLTIADKIVMAKAGAVIAEGRKVTLSLPGAGSLSPSSITAMAGLNLGSALSLPSSVSGITGGLSSLAGQATGSLSTAISSVSSSLSTLQNSILPSTNLPAFGSVLNQVQSHITDAVDLKSATNFVSSANLGDFGSGISKLSDLSNQGLSGAVGSLSGAATALRSTGTMFDGIDPANFGSPVGLVQSLTNNKLANITGVNDKLVAAGVDLNNLEDPVYAGKIQQVLGSIKDPEVIKTVSDQFGIVPHDSSQVQSLADLGDYTKLVSPTSIAGLTTDANGIATKFKDLGADFSTTESAASMLENISVPNVPEVDKFATLGNLMSYNSSTIQSMTGEIHSTTLNPNQGPDGLPSLNDFTQHVTGGPAMTQMQEVLNMNLDVSDPIVHAANCAIVQDAIDRLDDSITKAHNLYQTAGIDLSSPPPNGLSSALNFATSLHQMGANEEMHALVATMANTDNHYGQAVIASLAEGKNKALMEANGIKPLNFQG